MPSLSVDDRAALEEAADAYVAAMNAARLAARCSLVCGGRCEDPAQ